MDDVGRRGGDVPGARAVDPGRVGLVLLGAVDVGPGRAVDDGVGPRGRDGGADGVGIGDVEVAAGETGDLVPRALRGGDDITAQHARSAGDEKAHRGLA